MTHGTQAHTQRGTTYFTRRGRVLVPPPKKGTRTMKAKANLFRTLVVLWVVVVAGAVALFGVGLRSGETQTTTSYYKVQDLGTLGGNIAPPAPNSFATDINDSGQVVGYGLTSIAGYTVPRAFLYDESATPKMQDLGDLGGNYATYAKGINDSGKVVGSSHTSDGEQHAFLYDSTNGMQDLNDFIPANSGWSGGPISDATAINSYGKIAANQMDFTENVCQYEHEFYSSVVGAAYVLTPATTATYDWQRLGTLGGNYSETRGINDSGKVVGVSQSDCYGEHAFLYDENATPKMLDLGALGGDYWIATDINDSDQVSDQVVGYGVLNGSHAFLYDSATQQMQDLGDLEGGNKSDAMGINDSGQVVGRSYEGASSYISGPGRAFVKESGQPMRNLNTLIPADSGWTIYEAMDINSDGQIAATGYKAGVGTHALLLTPTSDSPPPADTEAPSSPTITSPQNNSYDTDGSFSVSGSAEASSTVELFEGTTSKGTTKADSSSGAWSIALSGLSEGAHTYTAKATDAAGNTSSASDSITVTVDKTAPKVDSVIPKEDATGVAPGDNVTAAFSEGMQDASVKSAFKLYKKGTTTALAATVSYDATTRKATLDPRDPLRSGATYKAVVSTGAKDLAGNSLDQNASLSGSQQKVWFFKVS
jgi:probable HAF family extracellular repeat protein